MSADLDALVALVPFAAHLGLVLDEADASRMVAGWTGLRIRRSGSPPG